MKCLISLFCLLLLKTLFAQVEVAKEKYFYKSKAPHSIQFTEKSALKISQLENFFLENYQLKLELKELNATKDELGFTNFKYQQIIGEYKVELGIINVLTKNDIVKSINGHLFYKEPSISSNINTEEESLEKVLNYINAKTYKWENEKEEKWLKISTKNRYATFYPKGELVWCSDQLRKDMPLYLAYKFEVYASEPLSKSVVYIDALTNKILAQNEIIHHVDAIGTGNTGYSGQQTITTDFNGTNYRLRETGRGNGIETYDMQGGVSYGNAIDFTNNTNTWNSGTAQDYLFALDAHWGSEMVYDYYLTNHNRNSIDGNGFKLRSYIHYDVNFANAFWDGSVMTYGDGSTGSNPYTTLDIVAHEITHGLTTNTAGLIYSYESGALNESFSDIFGVSTEFFAKPNQANWLIGDERGGAIRSLSNPNAFGHPDTYKGVNWEYTSFDNGGVHINSGVQNYWFYILVTGGSGTNDKGDSFTVSGIGQTKAAKIAYRNLTTYLTNSSNFAEARFYSIQSAIDLYGVCSPEVESVTNAWYAVGVGNQYVAGVTAAFQANTIEGCEAPLTINFENYSVNATNFIWDFGDGTSSTSAFPSHTYTTTGTFNVTLTADGGSCGVDQDIKNNYITIDNSIPCENMILNSTITRSSCSGQLFDSGGENGNYSANENSYALISPNSGLPFTLNIDFIDIEEEISCDYDVLKIYDGTNLQGNLIGVICNNSGYSSSLTSSSGSIFLHFSSDTYVEGSGFKVSWDCSNSGTSVQLIEDCTGELFDSGGENSNYGDNEQSIVTIEPLGATQIDLIFSNFDVENEPSCNYDYVEVFDGDDVYAPLIGRYCNGTPPPSVIQSSGGAITIKFFSDSYVTGGGYKYTWNCKATSVDILSNEVDIFNLYPNPAKEHFYIGFKNQEYYKLILKDVSGKEILRIDEYRSESKVNLENLSNGVYIVSLFDDGFPVISKKIIIN